MNMNTTEKLQLMISGQGAISIDQFLYITIQDYYSNNNSIGKHGDFITAPEISQMFGEAIAIWCISTWEKLGQPKISLMELGGGRGTLMVYLLRVAQRNHAFQAAIERIVMIETSPFLQKIQGKALANHDVIWDNNIENIEGDNFFIISNEFFDALPTKQFMKTSGKWHEVMITYQDGFQTVLSPLDYPLAIAAEEGDIFEYSPMAEAIVHSIAAKSLAGLVIDYGYLASPMISTLQSVKSHERNDIFNNIGEADITYLVNFPEIKNILQKNHKDCTLYTQGHFLKTYGIEFRAAQLIKNGAAAESIKAQLHRLISPERMGELFKVLEYVRKQSDQPEY